MDYGQMTLLILRALSKAGGAELTTTEVADRQDIVQAARVQASPFQKEQGSEGDKPHAPYEEVTADGW
jgi:hypothetical protein